MHGQTEALISRARIHLDHGQYPQAIDVLRQALSLEPDDAYAHALLSVTLHDARRLFAAEHEATLALRCDPELPLAHYAMAHVLISKRRLAEAEVSVARALELAPQDPYAHRLRARLLGLQGRRAEVGHTLERALTLDPEDVDTLADLAEHHLDRGALGQAERYATAALEEAPEHLPALVVMGHLHLRQCRVDEAREHAVWALRNAPDDQRPLYLLAAIKTRTNPLLGLWWRFSTWMGELGDGRSIFLLLGAFVVVTVARAFLQVGGEPELDELVGYLWLAICAYTWVGPALFQRSLSRELDSVRLDERF